MFDQTENKDFKDRLVASYSFLIPAKKYSLDFDITTKTSLPAFLESSIMLVDCLGKISPLELQTFFGLSDSEREELLRLIEGTDLAFLNSNGELEKTDRLDELKQHDGTIQLEDVEQHQAQMIVDLFSGNIQPRAIEAPILGLHTPTTDKILATEIEGETVFKEGFNRFKACSKVPVLQKQNTRLYRINSCESDEVTTLPFSLNIYAKADSFRGVCLESSVQGFDTDSQLLIDSSGLLGHMNEYLDQPCNLNTELSLAEYCELVDDPVLGKYECEAGFDLEAYLRDREQKKTGYGSLDTRGIIGPLYLEKNRTSFLNWLKNIPHDIDMGPAFWWPSDDKFWGSSIYLKTFWDQASKKLAKRNGSIALTFPSLVRGDNYDFQQRLDRLARNIISIQDAEKLNRMELFVLPGKPCWAMVQYHVKLPRSLHFKSISVPIGYTTYDPERVAKLTTLLSRKVMNGAMPKYIRRVKTLDDLTAKQNIDLLTSLR